MEFCVFEIRRYPTRNRGKSDDHVLGGMHMTNYGYLPNLILKRLTQSEGSYEYLKEVAELPRYAENTTLEGLQNFYREEYYKTMKFRIFDLKKVEQIDSEKDDFVVLPWFYNCNRERYPAWERKSDSRLY